MAAHSRKRLVAMVFAALGLAVPALAQGTFAYRKQITVNGGAGGLAGGPHLNFPLLVSLPNDADLLAHVAAGGRDIEFRGEDVTTCAGVPSPCILPHEIERWDGATGTLVAWVKVPSVDAGTVIYMYYGNAQTPGIHTPAAVWDSGYVGVWHLGETGGAAANEYRDATTFVNHGRGGRGAANAVPARVNGKIGYAQNFSNGDGTYDFIDSGSDDSLNISGTQITLEAWVRHNIVVNAAHGTPAAATTPYGILAHKGYFDGYSLWLYGADDGTCPGSSTVPCVVFNLPGRSFSLRTNMTTGPSAGTWHHIVGTYDGATMTLYQDGAVITTLAKTGNIAPSSAESQVYIGQGDLPENVAWSAQFVGDLDEVRISNVTRPVNWLLTEYRNQLAPASFYGVGAESTVGGPWSLTPYTVNFRSIGDTFTIYLTGTVIGTTGSVIVDGVGTAWLTANRGRGDRITIDSVDYTILAVESETRLRLTSPFTSPTNSYTYTITRKFGTPQAWENCVSGGACPGVFSTSLVADNRSEVGIFYYDSGVLGGPGPLITFDGSITDGSHTITLTVDPGNRHPGNSAGSPTWAGMFNTGAGSMVRIWDGNVTVEWLDLFGGSGDPIEINNVPVGAPVTVRDNLIHSAGASSAGIRILHPDTVANIYNNMIYDVGYGIRFVTDLNPAARVNIFNNTIFANKGATGPSGIKSTVRQTTPRIDLRNNIVHSNNTGDIGIAPRFDRAWFYNGAYTDIRTQVADSTVNFTLNFATVGTDCLYLGSQNPFRGVAYDAATGASGGMDLQWSYWNGGAWANLETTPFTDGTFQLQYDGYLYWSDDPAGWATTTVSDATALYYVRACLASGPPATKPVERQISRADLSIASTANLTFDMTGLPSSPRGGFVAGQNGVPLASLNFVNTTLGSENLHLQAGSAAIGAASTIDSLFTTDIDATVRTVPWDVGADEYNGTTEVRLQSFSALPGDASVGLEWRTASELDNLGFYVYRGPSADGPWQRLTATLIPGLGSSAVGQAYSFQDAGLVNGTPYFYRLEDVDAVSRTTSHGPVSAVPQAAASGSVAATSPAASRGSAGKRGTPPPSCPDWVRTAYASATGAEAAAASLTCTRHGEPEASSLAVVARDSRSATLELRTGGFYALHTLSGAGEASGRVRVFVPGFDFPQDAEAAALPVRRALVDAVVGRSVQLGGVRALDPLSVNGLVPSSVGRAEMQISRDGTVRASRREGPERTPARVSNQLATLEPSVFQGETKSAVVRISPLRFDARSQRLVLARSVRVRLLFTGRESGESGRGGYGRRPKPEKPGAGGGELLARLYTTSPGVYAVRFEALFPGRSRGFAASELSLEWQGQARAFHLEPASGAFGPGSVLYFYADTQAGSTHFSSETAWELLHAQGGVTMPVVSVAPGSDPLSTASTRTAAFEVNRFYQPGLLDAPDPWLWEALASGATRTETFTLSGADTAASGAAELVVFLQGASESGGSVDHHIRVALAGVPVGEAQFAGKTPCRMTLSVPASLLREGANELSLTNVADTGVSSLVFLDRFTLSYPQAPAAVGGSFDGSWSAAGTARVGGLAAPVLVDVTPAASGTSWLTGYALAGDSLQFRAEAGHRYLAVSAAALVAPRVALPQPSTLQATTNQADYILIAPRAFLSAAEPLVQRRQDQGLTTRAVAFEEIASEFAHGQPSAEAIRSFIAYAYQSWARPSPRYVLLLGDSSYDPRNFMGTSGPSPLPALWTKTSYLWTASDPLLAAVNGDDALPDLAIGRLPATTVEQAGALVAKLLAWEDSGQGLSGPAVLVADNPDLGGDFEADVRDIASSFLSQRSPRLLLLSELGAGTRPAIQEALDSGLGLLSYVGHGGSAVWASENVWNSWDAPSLQVQSRQPLLTTMNCLNGYFVAPTFDSLTESLLKAEGRGAIAGFSPSGLSLDGPAHQYHRALLAEVTSGRHERLGDALLAAQRTYAQSGLMPELLTVYHLFGDPATRIH